jgi:hypothetical protein
LLIDEAREVRIRRRSRGLATGGDGRNESGGGDTVQHEVLSW